MTDRPIKPDELVLRINELPVIPSAIAEILRVVNDSAASSVDIEWAVSRDQSVAAKVLKVVNSAAYGFIRRVETVREAVVMLGLRKMRDIAASMAAAELFLSGPKGLVDSAQLWLHGLATSIWAREIISRKRLTDMDVVITAGLLHDIGILILHQFCTERYHEVLTQAQKKNRHHESVEKRLLKTTHARVGATLCAKWKLPISLTQLISHHHSKLCPSDPALALLMLADHLAHEFGQGPFPWGSLPTLHEDVLVLLEIDQADMNMLVESKQDVVDQVNEFKSVVLGENK